MTNVNVNTGSGGGVYSPLQDPNAPAGAPGAVAAPAPGAELAKDSLQVAGNQNANAQLNGDIRPYVAPSDRPALPAPANPESLFVTNPETGKPQLNVAVSSKPILSQSNNEDSAFASSLNDLINQAQQSQGLSDDDAALLRFAYYHPDSEIVPDNLKDLSKSLIQQATDQVKDTFQDPAFDPSPDTTTFDNSVSDLFQNDFNAALKNYAEENGLSDSDVARLIYAQNHPDGPVDPKDAAILKEINTQVTQDLSQEYGLPTALQPQPDTEFFDAQISQHFESNFEGLLNAYSEQNGLSAKDTATIKFSFMHPEADIPVSEGGVDYKAIAANLSSQASAQTSKADGLPPGVSPSPPTKTFDQIVSGGFVFAARDGVTDPAQGLSKEDQETVFKLVTGQLSMDDPSVPDALKDSAKAIKRKAMQKIMAQFGLPPGQFELNAKVLANASVKTPQNLQIQTGTVKLAAGMTAGFKNTLQEMPEGGDKSVYANYLTAIGKALQDLREVLYTIEQKDSDLSKEMSNWSLESSKNRNDMNTAKRDETLKKARKAAKGKGGVVGALMKFFKKLGPIIGAIMATAMLGPVGLALSVLDTKLQIFSKLSNLVGDVGAKMAQAMGASEKVADRLRSAFKVMFIATFFLAQGPMAGTSFMTFGPQLISESEVISDIAKSAGAKPELANKLAMYVTMAIGAAIAVAMMVVPIPGPQIAALAKGVTEALKTVADALINVCRTMADAMAKMITFAVDKLAKMSSLETQLSQVASLANDAIKIILDSMKSLLGAFSKGAKYSDEAFQVVSSKLDEAISSAQDFMKSITDLFPPGQATNILNKVGNKVGDISENVFDHVVQSLKNPITIASGFETAANIQGAISNLQLAAFKRNQAKIEQILGQMDGMIELLTNMIKQLRQALDKIIAGLSATAQQVGDINTQVTSLYQDAGASQSRLLSA